MANVRQLKKAIKSLCGDMAAETLIASELVKNFDRSKTPDILSKVAALQNAAIERVKFSFDKSVKDFESKAAYNKAKSIYYRQAFAKLNNEIKEAAVKIVDEMNGSMPKA